ncbi:MAG: YvcK family protein, partial [Candidatus Roizmanbacteria bacterium]|nr:YvcK family protein [Candidatus Roizmanbacteria bacterium]
MKKVTVIGGGTGTFVVLSGLKDSPVDLSVVVSMMDSGGSTGILRDQLGILPPGDLRQCLVALSDAPILWRKLFLYRFEKGDLKGHNFGNIFLAALEKVSNSYDEAIETVSYVLKTKGKVIPVTHDKSHLVVEYENGSKVTGEGLIDENHAEKSRINKAYLEPKGKANPKATKSIEDSDFIVIGPGDLYTSILPHFLVDGFAETLKNCKAKIVFCLNLMTKPGETDNFKASDFIEELIKYSGNIQNIHHIIANTNGFPKELLEFYAQYNQHPVEIDIERCEELLPEAKITTLSLSRYIPEQKLIRHD